MWYVCGCGKTKSGQPFKNSGYRPWMCERCKRKAQVPIIKTAVKLSSILLRLATKRT